MHRDAPLRQNHLGLAQRVTPVVARKDDSRSSIYSSTVTTRF